jgi:N-acetylmuramoyl-L-alanine amidase
MGFPYRFSGERDGNRLRATWLLVIALLAGCQHAPAPAPAAPPAPVTKVVAPNPPVEAPKPPIPLGEVIIVAGQRFHTGTRVVTWLERGAYRASPRTYDVRQRPAPSGDKEPRKPIPSGLVALQGVVDQLVLHYDQAGLSRICFDALEQRGLSIHFMIDVDGTIYQPIDLEARAMHATTSNSRSIGIEIANVGAFPPKETQLLAKWYQADGPGKVRIKPPREVKETRIHTPNFVARPARAAPVRGIVQGRNLTQYDYTPEQYAALARLTAALCRVFPLIKCDYPRDAAGHLITHKLPDAVLEKYQGIIGHFHIQENKIDPGPAFDWEKIIGHR